ncbi:tubulin-folding cofactor B [Aspergillus affinis]|uniref:tubulin-folding cofactor B n=1 Tax=Aspergillus affinis TaxID=1070780 RepID=UPI0022FE901D|nr:Cap-Gly domain-containing protein [Aspergillus affinis]KAI9041533.1 Cap-Gly domain-containing protein [Aspergillus affinis]
MAFQPTPADVAVIITTPSAGPNAGSQFQNERRITPTWTVMQLKSKLETMTGIPPGSQRLHLKPPGLPSRWIDGDETVIGDWGLVKGCEIEVHDSRPQSARPNFNDLSSVEKYVLPSETYESLPNSVLAWKRNQKLGRFDPNALTPEESMRRQAEQDAEEVAQRGIVVSRRAIILPSSPPHIRRGTVRFVGPVPTIPYPGVNTMPGTSGGESDDSLPLWIGVELDEPTGKNDGSVGGQRFFTCPSKSGLFVKPDKIQVGDFPPLDLDDDLGDMEEL